jgi:hypothetical protein
VRIAPRRWKRHKFQSPSPLTPCEKVLHCAYIMGASSPPARYRTQESALSLLPEGHSPCTDRAGYPVPCLCRYPVRLLAPGLPRRVILERNVGTLKVHVHLSPSPAPKESYHPTLQGSLGFSENSPPLHIRQRVKSPRMGRVGILRFAPSDAVQVEEERMLSGRFRRLTLLYVPLLAVCSSAADAIAQIATSSWPQTNIFSQLCLELCIS